MECWQKALPHQQNKTTYLFVWDVRETWWPSDSSTQLRNDKQFVRSFARSNVVYCFESAPATPLPRSLWWWEEETTLYVRLCWLCCGVQGGGQVSSPVGLLLLYKCMYVHLHTHLFFVFVFGLGYVSWRVVLFCFVGWLCVYACTYICMFRCTYVCFENEMWVCKSLTLFLLFVCCLCCLSVLFSLLIFSVGFIIVVVVASFSDA